MKGVMMMESDDLQKKRAAEIAALGYPLTKKRDNQDYQLGNIDGMADFLSYLKSVRDLDPDLWNSLSAPGQNQIMAEYRIYLTQSR